jgi:gliding motility-associated-like protein
VSDANGCTKSITASLVSPGNIQINQILVDNDSCTMNLYNQVTVITLGGTDPKTFRLSPGGTINSTGIFYNLEPDTYYVQAKDANGCATNSKFTVTKNECCNVPFVANAFSPNNDGLNDELHLVYFPGVTIEKFLIMNRYGQVVFSPQHTLDRWDGKFKSVECEIGSYYYLLQYKCNRTNERGVVKGDITLLR